MLQLVTDLANQRNIKEVGGFLESEIRKAKKMQDSKADDKDKEKLGMTSSTNEYRYMLIKCIN